MTEKVTSKVQGVLSKNYKNIVISNTESNTFWPYYLTSGQKCILLGLQSNTILNFLVFRWNTL